VVAFLGFEMLVVTEINKGIQITDAFKPDVATLATIAAIGASIFDEFLTMEAFGASTAVSALYKDFCFVEKFHFSIQKKSDAVASRFVINLDSRLRGNDRVVLFGCCLSCGIVRWNNVNNRAVVIVTGEDNLTIDESEESVVFTDSNILTLFERRAALTNDNVASYDAFATKTFNAKTTTCGIATVAGTTACFFMCHFLNPSACPY
jgi:hypothetical protein